MNSLNWLFVIFHAVSMQQHTVALPIYPELITEMQNYVVEKIGEFYE